MHTDAVRNMHFKKKNVYSYIVICKTFVNILPSIFVNYFV